MSVQPQPEVVRVDGLDGGYVDHSKIASLLLLWGSVNFRCVGGTDKSRGDTMDSVEALLTQVAKKRKLDPTVKGLDSLISALRRWQREAEAGSSGTDALREQVSEQGLQELVHGHHKAVNAAVSKLGKGIDKAMASHVELPLERMPGALISQAVLQKLLQPPPPARAMPHTLTTPLTVLQVHQHLMAEGSFEAARLMSIDSAGGSERGGEVEAALEAALREMHAVLLALQRHELGPAFAWLERHREGLEAKSSTLEFRLRQLEFTLLLRRGPPRAKEL